MSRKKMQKSCTYATLSECKIVFTNVSELIRNKDTVCGHNGFESQAKYVLSLIELLTLDAQIQLAATKRTLELKRRKLKRKQQEFASHLMKIMTKTNSMRPCFQCSELMMCEILHIYYSKIVGSKSRCRQLSFFVALTEFQWLGPCSLYTNVGRYFYSKTNIFRILYANFIAFCQGLQTNLFNIDTHEINPHLMGILNHFNLFSVGFVANLYRLKTPQWIQLLIAHNFFVKILNVMHGHCILMWNIHFSTSNKDVMTQLHIPMYVLFVILTFGLHHLQKQHILQEHKNNIQKCLTKFETLLINTSSQQYFASYIKSTILLFDDDKKKNYVMFYKKIRKYSNKCKKEMYKNSKCNNMKCSKAKAECKYCCSKCQVAIYCSKKCQKYDWNRGYHRSLCQKYCIDPQKLYGI